MIRTKRITQWTICIVVALILMFGENFICNTLLKEKIAITVSAPDDMKESFKSALKKTDLKGDYKIAITTEKKADISVEYGKKGDETYQKFAFSPFVVAYSSDEDYFKKLKKSNTVVESKYNDQYYEIDFLKVINEVIEEGEWENLGIKDIGKIKVFYPSEKTIYWEDFLDFMIVTVNGGEYPKTVEDLEKSKEAIQRFIKSPYTEPVDNFDEKLERTNGFSEKVFYVFPEKTGYELAIDHSEYTRFFYPLTTVYFNYYVKGISENGQKVLNGIKESDFYPYLRVQDYRSENEYELSNNYRHIYDDRDIYNVVEVPKNEPVNSTDVTE